MHGGASRGEPSPNAEAATASIASESLPSSLAEAEEFDVWIGVVEVPMASATLNVLQYPHDAEFVRAFWNQFDPGSLEPSDDGDDID